MIVPILQESKENTLAQAQYFLRKSLFLDTNEPQVQSNIKLKGWLTDFAANL